MEITEARIKLMEDNWSDLLRFLCGDTDPQSFGQLRLSLFWTLKERGLTDEAAEDAIQDAMLKAVEWQASGRLAEVRNAREWLRRTALNAAWTITRRRHHKKTAHPPEVAIHPDTALEDEEEKQVRLLAIHSVLEEIDPSLREIFLRYVEGDSSIRELADSSGLPVGTVSGQISRGRRAIRDLLRADGFEIPRAG